jgi:uncharacterized protein (DUF302 family)
MGLPVKRRTRVFNGIRVQVDTSTGFATVCNRLRALMGRATILDLVELATEPISEAEFADLVNERYIGRSGFTLFYEIDHGGWISKFDIHRRTLRLILGNPLVAIALIRHDLTAGLFAPLEILVTEHEGPQGTNVTYILPSSLILIEENAALRAVAESLDERLSSLVASAVCDDLASRLG